MVVTDHIRTAVMLIGDGVTPGNEGRGYVLRRIMRRAIRNMRLLGATGPVVQDLIDVVIGMMGQQYPELVTDVLPVAAGHIPAPTAPGIGTTLLPEVRQRPDATVVASTL